MLTLDTAGKEFAFLQEAAFESVANPQVKDALTSDWFPSSAFMRRGNPAFNAYALACQELATDPEAPLVERKIQPDRGLISTTLTGYLIDILNSSMDRNFDGPNAIESLDGEPNPGVCKKSEANFARALGLTTLRRKFQTSAPPNHTPSKNELFVDEYGQRILFKKALWEPSAISFAPITLHGIVHPPGTLFGLKRWADAQGVKDAVSISKTLDLVPLTSIHSLTPRRLSLYGLPVAERRWAMRPPRLAEPSDEAMLGIHESRLSLTDLQANLPTEQKVAKKLVQMYV